MTATNEDIHLAKNAPVFGEEPEDAMKDMYLTFRLGDEDYGIEIRFVTEIVGMQNITEVPDMPGYVKGVVNLRGQVIPVIDMRIRLHMQSRSYDERTCIVVLNINNVQVGIVVDTVNEVRTIAESQVSPAPRDSAPYIRGMGKVGNDIVILLEGQRLIHEREILGDMPDFG